MRKKKKIIFLIAGIIAIALCSCFVVCKITHKADISFLEVSPKHAYNKKMTIIDIRPKERCIQTGKAKDSYSLPVSETASPKEYLENARKIAKGNTIAFICNTGRSSYMVTQQYRELFNAKDVTSITGGMEGTNGWLTEKLPVESCN